MEYEDVAYDADDRRPCPDPNEIPDELMTQLVFEDETPKCADVAVVFGKYAARSQLDQRARRALELFREGIASQFVCTGFGKVKGGNRQVGVSAAAYIAKSLASGGVPRKNIFIYRDRCEFPCSGALEWQSRDNSRCLKNVAFITCPLSTRWMRCGVGTNYGSGFGVFMSPHREGCTAETWTSQESWRASVRSTFVWLMGIRPYSAWASLRIDRYREHGAEQTA